MQKDPANTPGRPDELHHSHELELEPLDVASRAELGFPHDFAARNLFFGKTEQLIDDNRSNGGVT